MWGSKVFSAEWHVYPVSPLLHVRRNDERTGEKELILAIGVKLSDQSVTAPKLN